TERALRSKLEDANTLEDVMGKVKPPVPKTTRDQWLTGRRLIETFWKPPQFPTRQDLDKTAPRNPVFLARADGHGAIANSAALKIAKIDKTTPNPFGGEILKDKASGEPTGMLLDNAMDLVEKSIPKPSAAERQQALLTGINREVGLGWCEIQNAGSHRDDVDLIKKALESGKIKIRFINAIYGPGEDAQHFLKEGVTLDAFNQH